MKRFKIALLLLISLGFVSLSAQDCQADFAYSKFADSVTIQFTDLSTSAEDILFWNWSFGDGHTSTETNPSHTFDQSGSYDVCLTISTNQDSTLGCSSTQCRQIWIGGDTLEACQANFTYELNDPTNEIQFTDQSKSGEDILFWNWSFGDGHTSTETNPSHTFDQSGSYDVCLTISTNQDSTLGCSSTQCRQIWIGGDTLEACQANFTYELNDPTNEIQFTDQSTSGEDILFWNWSFGDGHTSTETNPSHTFDQSGSYDVCLTISTNQDSTLGCSSTQCRQIWIGGDTLEACQANFTYELNNPTNEIQFTDQSTSGEDILFWNWSFGDGHTSTETNPSHTFDQSGSYDVCLTISTNQDSTLGCSSTQCRQIWIGGDTLEACQADFDVLNDTLNLEVEFIDMSTSSLEINSWIWDFGDGGSSNEANPTHQYQQAGSYQVCLTIETEQGPQGSCTSSYCKEIDLTLLTGEEYSLGGNVFAGIYQLDNGMAQAFRMQQNQMIDVANYPIDSLGYYLFSPLTEDSYYVKVKPAENSIYQQQYIPTYYGDVSHWEDAEAIHLNQDLYTQDIHLIEVAQKELGNGSIRGEIIFQGGRNDNQPAQAIQIMLTNQEGAIVAVTYSDSHGQFYIDSLANGSYVLYAEIPGLQVTPKAYLIDDDNQNIEQILMVIKQEEIVFGVEEINSVFIEKTSDIFPNPVRDILKINIQTNQDTRIECNIINLTGQSLIRKSIEMPSSHFNTLEVQTATLKRGIYLFEIRTEDNFRITKRFVKY